MRPLLVGENNPYSRDPEDALLPYPDGSAGWRLCVVILKLQRARYLRAFDRRNLLSQVRWSAPAARAAAGEICAVRQGPLILLGKKVAAAFGLGDLPPFSVDTQAFNGQHVVLLPHPSGLCRVWNEPGAFERAREMVVPLIEAEEEEPVA